MTPCSVVGNYKSVGENYCLFYREYGGSKFFRNVIFINIDLCSYIKVRDYNRGKKK
jgi:hypothetical protein